MNTIIQEFIKEINKNMVESLKNLENDFMFSNFTDDLMGSLMKLGSKIATEFIKTLENDIYLSKKEKVYTYLTEKYDYDKLDNIYIMVDGANWITAGLNEIPKSKYIMDKFHLEKAIVKMTKNNKEYINKIKEVIKMIKNKNIIRNDGLIYSILDMIYGDFEFKEQIKVILANKVI